jgi:alpha-glucosidase
MKTVRNLLCGLAALLALSLQAKETVFTSPDTRYVLTLDDGSGQVAYSLQWDGKTVILPSVLGIEAGRPMRDGLRIGEIRDLGETDTTWKPVYGERAVIPDHFKAWEVSLLSPERRPVLGLEIRAYNEGIAFRYLVTAGSYIHITDEFTEYTLPEGTLAYFTPRAQTPYSLLPLKDWPGDGESDRPLLIRLPEGGFACLAEAQVVDYVRTKFRLADKPNTVTAAMYGPVDEIAPYNTPWRMIMCGQKAGEIMEHNYLFYNLNPPCAIEDPSWIKPGKMMREVTLTTEGGMAVVDFAARHKLSYVLFDAGWYGHEYDKASDATTVTLDPRRNPNPNALDLPAVVAYARSKGIGIFLYVNMRALAQQLDEILPLYEEWGIAGVKFGFVQVGSQVWTKWMHEAVRKCAEHHLMVDIHDEYRPTGFSRTYPNLMTQEGVRGNEEFPDAFNNTMLPFTRYVAGPADYTICYYRQDFGRLERQEDAHGVPRSKSIQTTPAHQLALAAVYYSPLQVLYWYDKPSDSQDEPELKFFDDVPTVWDDTKVIEGEPGEYITTARRHGEQWFVGTITNAARDAAISLDFLPAGDYIAEIYTDGDASIPTRTKVRVSKFRVNAATVLRFSLRKAGGAAVRLVPEPVKDKAVKDYRKKQVI